MHLDFQVKRKMEGGLYIYVLERGLCMGSTYFMHKYIFRYTRGKRETGGIKVKWI